MEQYAIYLRKSRADAEAEAHGEGETLARHQTALLALAKKLDLFVGAIYKEIVSGETIAARPMMQQLLAEVRQGLWAGVLVMEVERLARGNTMDQGYVAQSFAFRGTKIITPLKTYDPADEYDQEYFEFGLFMSRREYMTINRRIQRGRRASAQEGKYYANVAPYGYARKKLEKQKGFILEPTPEESNVVKMVFDWYLNGPDGVPIGISKIARRLNALHIPPPRIDVWTANTVRSMLQNPTYAGKITWGRRGGVKNVDKNGGITCSRPRAKEYDLFDGLHTPLVSVETWERVQVRLADHKDMPTPWGRPVQNPLCGLIVCGLCGRKMRRKPGTSTPDFLICAEPQCSCVGSYLSVVEEALLKAMGYWIETHKVPMESAPACESFDNALKNISAERAKLQKQKNSLYDLLEQGLYTPEIFLERSKDISARLSALDADEEGFRAEIAKAQRATELQQRLIPKMSSAIELYRAATNPAEKNRVLKEVLDHVVYTRTAGGRWAPKNNFTLDLFPLYQKE